MSLDAAASAFRPASLPTTGGLRAGDERSERSRAAGYAAGWSAGARAAAESAVAQQRRLAEEHERAEAAREAALARAVSVLERAAAAASSRTVPVVTEAREWVYEVALELAGAVLQRELGGSAAAEALLDRALSAPADLGVHTVRLNPADLEQVRAVLADSPHRLPDGVELVADPRLGTGDAISEHPTGFLDAQVSTALDRARRALLEQDEQGES